jgi:hypothetical protein
MANKTLQGCEVLELNKDPERGLLEIRDGKFWDGEPVVKEGDDLPPVADGFYFVELTPDGRWILNDKLYGPYATELDAVLAAEDGMTLTDLDRLVREGFLRRERRAEVPGCRARYVAAARRNRAHH